MSHDPEEYREPFAIEWDWRKIALILAAALAMAAWASAAEVKRCDLAPWPVPPLASYVPAPMQGDLRPRLADGTPTEWGAAPNARLVIVLAGFSNVVQLAPGFMAEMKALVGSKGGQILIVSVAGSGVSTREWADPNSIAWTKVLQILAAKHVTPAQVAVWIQPHAVLKWASLGLMTVEQLAAIKAHVRAIAPNTDVFIDSDLTTLEWAHAEPGAAGVSVDGVPYPAGMLTGHPSPLAIAHDTEVLADAAINQTGVPFGARAEYVPISDLKPDCATGYQADGVHYTPSGGALVGAALADRAWAWLRLWIGWAR